MANIAIITDAPDIPSIVAVKAMIEALGHSCVAYSEVDETPLTSFDLIVATRINGGVSNHGKVITAFNSGVPVIVGLHREAGTGIGSGANSLVGKLALASTVSSPTFASIYTSTSTYLDDHYPVGTTVQTNDKDEASSYVEKASVATGATILFSHPSNALLNSSVVIAAKGATNLSGEPFPAACAFTGFLYTANTVYTEAGKLLFGRLIEKVLAINIAKTHSISGYVLDDLGAPLSNDVYLYDQVSMLLVDKTTPDEFGAYTFMVEADINFFLVCTSPTSSKNFKIHSFVQGVLI